MTINKYSPGESSTRVMHSRSVAFLFATFLSLTTLSAGQTPSFIARRDFATSTSVPGAVVTADVNNDGIPDMVATGDSKVFVLLGNGDGTFQPAAQFPGGTNNSQAQFIAVADFNGDGNLDVAVTSGDSISILLGNGDGSLQSPMQFATGITADFIAVGDFNGDSIPDLAVTNRGNPNDSHGGNVAVLIGSGDGTFSAPGTYTVGSGPRSVAIADFNGDGIQDLVVTNWGHFVSGNDNPVYVPDTTISVLFGNGDGTFQLAQNRNVGTGPRSVIVGDFNGDGNPDLAVALEQSATPNHGAVQILFGDGAGGFSNGAAYVVGFSPQQLALGDINADGVGDLAIACRSGLASVLLGRPDGSFQPGSDVPVANVAASLVLMDLNGDGTLDIALATNISAVSVVFGHGDGTFQTAAAFPDGGRTASSIVSADFNGDGNVDVAVTNGVDNTVSIMLGNGDGTLKPPQTIPVGQSPRAITAVDLNGDGTLDLVVADIIDDNFIVLLGNGDGTFRPPSRAGNIPRPSSLVVGDFNNDGIPDVVATSNVAGDPMMIFVGNGDGTFQQGTSLGIFSRFAAAGDLNGDGNLDLLITGNGSISVLLGNGNGTFEPPIDHAIAGGNAGFVAVGDFNHDGILDLAATFSSFNPSTDPTSMVVLVGNGDGTFQDQVGYNFGQPSISVSIADVTGDGNLDLVVNANGSVAVLTGNGDGGFEPAVLFGPAGHTPAEGNEIGIGDFNNDGKLDIAVPDAVFTVRGTAILLNNQP